MRFRLGEGLETITTALCSLRECAREHRAFVVIEDTVTGRFVQFSGSATQLLWFDAPQLGVVNSGPKFEDPAQAAAYAIEQLKGPHALPDFAELVIVFDSCQTSRKLVN